MGDRFDWTARLDCAGVFGSEEGPRSIEARRMERLWAWLPVLLVVVFLLGMVSAGLRSMPIIKDGERNAPSISKYLSDGQIQFCSRGHLWLSSRSWAASIDN